jgi:hypothetical protein
MIDTSIPNVISISPMFNGSWRTGMSIAIGGGMAVAFATASID